MNGLNGRASLNGKAPVRAGAAEMARKVRRGRLWLLLPAGLLALNVVIVGVTVTLAVGDKSVATEPDYYRKAVNFDDEARLREESRRLGWKAEVTLGVEGGTQRLVVRLNDASGAPVEGAAVRVEAFAHVRSGDRQRLAMKGVEGEPGAYAGAVGVDRGGLWRVNVSAERGEERFVHRTELLVGP
ncbi:MAG: FixH family protein [Phycisphaerales bacterium]